MRFLDHTYVWDWCRTHGYDLIESEAQQVPRLADNPALANRDRIVHSAADDAPAAATLASNVSRVLGSWESCLVWATDWDIWQNEEDWPAYYDWRGAHGERRSLGAAPGHLFTREDSSDFLFLIAHAIRCGWDITLLPARAGRPTGVCIRCSHDEWIEVRADRPISFGVAAV